MPQWVRGLYRFALPCFARHVSRLNDVIENGLKIGLVGYDAEEPIFLLLFAIFIVFVIAKGLIK